MWIRTTRISLLVALALVVVVLAWLATHPELYSGHISRTVTQNLLRDTGVSFRYDTMEGNALGDLRLLGVDLSWQGRDGSFAYLSVDSLEISYDFFELLKGRIRIYRAAVISSRGTVRQRSSELPVSDRDPTGFSVPPISVEEAIVRDLEVRWVTAEGTEQSLEDFAWWGSIRQRDEGLTIDTRAMRGSWPQRDLNLHSVWGRAVLAEEGVLLRDFRASTDSTQIRADGIVGGAEGLSLVVEAEAISLREVLACLGKDTPISASFHGSASVRGLRPIVIEGLAGGHVQGYRFEDVDLVFGIDGSQLELVRGEGLLFDSPARMSGTIDTSGGFLQLRGSVEDFDLSLPWAMRDLGWPESSLNGRMAVSIGLKSPVTVDVQAEGVHGEVAELPVDSLRAHVEFEDGVGARISGLRVLTHGTWLEGEGSVDSTGVLDLPFTAQAQNLSSWDAFYDLPFEAAEGLSAQGRFLGPSSTPGLSVEGRLESLRGFRMEGRQVDAQFQLPLWNRIEDVRGDFQAADFLVAGRRVGSIEGSLDRQSPLTVVPYVQVSLGDTTFNVSGRVLERGNYARLEVDAAEFRLGQERWRLVEPAVLQMGSGWARTELLRVNSETGGWLVRGGLDSLGIMDLSVDLREGDLNLLSHLGLGPADLAGILGGSLTLIGERDNPDLRVDLEGRGLAGWGRALRRVRLDMDLVGAAVSIDSLSAEDAFGQLSVEGTSRLPRSDALRSLLQTPENWRQLLARALLDLRVGVQDFDARHWMDPTAPAADLGLATGGASVRGSLEVPEIQGEILIDDLVTGAGLMTIPRLRSSLHSDGTRLTLSRGTVHAPDPWLSFEASLPLRLSGIRTPQWEGADGVDIVLASNGEVELKPLAKLLEMVSEISGKGEFVYRARGTMSDPDLDIQLSVRDGIAQLKGSLERLREVELDASTKDGVLRITRAKAKEGLKGTVSATGEVVFKGLLPDDIRLDIQGDRFLFASYLHLRALLHTDDLTMTLRSPEAGLPRRPYFRGSLDVIKARYTGEFGEGGQDAGGISATTTPNWTADLHLRAPRTVRIQNGTAILLLDGDVDLVRDASGLRLNGIVGIPQGRVPIFNNDFDIVRGTLDYSRSKGLDPAVEIEAETRVQDFRYREGSTNELERVTVFLTGTFSDMRTRFESESGYDEETLVRLLAGFSEDPSQNALADTGFKAGLNFIERSIAQEIRGIDTLDIETESASLSEAERTRVAVGKYLSPDLYLRYSQGLSISERELFLEYQMTRQLRLSSELGTRLQGGGSSTTFNVDLKYRVEY